MKIESLLKSISDIIKKNEKFFIENPEIFLSVKERFEKAAYDDEEDGGYGDVWGAMKDREMGLDSPDDQDSADSEDEDYSYSSGEKDDGEDEDQEDTQDEDTTGPKASSDEEDAAQEKLLAQLQAQKDKKSAAKPASEAAPAAPAKSAAPAEAKPSAPGEWQPKSQYAPHHEKAIKELLGQGFSPREAERMADAHDKLSSNQMISSRTPPSHPSEKMLGIMKDLAGKWHADVTHKIGLGANPEENPELNFNSVKNQTVGNVFDAMHNATDAYKKSISHVKDPKQLTNMLTDFQHEWLQNNQHFLTNLHDAAEKVGQTATGNKEARENKRKEGQMAIIGATRASGEEAPSAAGDLSNMQGGAANKEAAKQSAGGFKTDEEGPTQTSTMKDPAHTLATRNPEYVKQQTIKFGEQHMGKMTPDQQQRFHEIKSKKIPTGNE